MSDISAGTLGVLLDQNQIIACITVDQQMDPLWAGLDWNASGEPAAAVHRLMVHPYHQGRGIARRLMLDAEIVAHAHGCRSIRLDSYLKNPAASALYPKLGYRQTGVVIMRKGEFAGFEKLLAAKP